MASIHLPDTSPAVLHATAVAVEGRGFLFVGPSGSGKSTLALQLLGHGAELISDDIVALKPSINAPILACPARGQEAGRIEARGVGILRVGATTSAPLCLIVDMGVVEQERLPEACFHQVDGVQVPVLKKVDTPAFPAILMVYVAQHAL